MEPLIMVVKSKRILIVFISLFISLLFASKISAEGRPLFIKPPVKNNADISRSQTQRLDQIKQRPTSASVTIVRIDVNALKGDSTLISLPGAKSLDFIKRDVEIKSDKSFNWDGTLPNVPGTATLVVHDGNVTGTVRNNGELYRIEPLGNGMHALIKVDQKRFPPEHPPSFKELEKRSDITPKKDIDILHTTNDKNVNKVGDSIPIRIDVLVAYTASAKTASADIDGTIELAVKEANQSYQNSGININLTQVDTFEVAYSEVGKNFDQILADFAAMPIVKNRREKSGADISVLIINKSDYCGLASAILANASNAFALVHYDCATGYYSFAHELGHLQGARHDEHNDSSITPFPYAHGYQHPAKTTGQRFRTIMAYACDSLASCEPRIQYWANPNSKYNGITLGTVKVNNDARVLNETASRVASFMSSRKQ